MCSLGIEFDFGHGDVSQRRASQVLAKSPEENAVPRWRAGAPPCLPVDYSHQLKLPVDAGRPKSSE